MATEKRVFPVGNVLVVIRSGEIVEQLSVSEERIKEEIDLLLAEEVMMGPRVIFQRAISNITGLKCNQSNQAIIIEDLAKKIEYKVSIHDNEMYRYYRDYIENDPRQRKKQEKVKEIRKKIREGGKKEEKNYKSYCIEFGIKIRRKMR